jgi:hypothetical protein
VAAKTSPYLVTGSVQKRVPWASAQPVGAGGPEDHSLGVRGELLENPWTPWPWIIGALMPRWSHRGGHILPYVFWLSGGGEAGSGARSGLEDVGGAHTFGPCNGCAYVENLKLYADTEVWLADKPEEGTGIIEWGQHRLNGKGGGGYRAGGLAQLSNDFHHMGQGDAKLGWVIGVGAEQMLGKAR